VADRSFLAGIDISRCAGLEQERAHVLRQKRPRLRVHHVQAVVVDQHRLLLQPIPPALSADLFDDAGPDCTRKGGLYESCARLTAPRAGYRLRHVVAYRRA